MSLGREFQSRAASFLKLNWPIFDCLFTCREGAPTNRATRLGGLKHSPPLHASHLGEIVSRAAANHNKQDGGQQKRFGGKLLFFITRSANGRFSVSRAIILHSTN